jgi:hypothetical protein
MTAGQEIIANAKEALAFAAGEDSGCVAHIPAEMARPCRLELVRGRKGTLSKVQDTPNLGMLIYL